MAPERTNGGWDSSQAPASDLGDAIGDPVYELVGNRFPGVAIQSPVQAWAFLERFDEGITKFHTIANPTPSDYRWYGVCLFQAVRDEESLAALYKARDLGDEGARVNLAHLLHFLERGDEASQELQEVQLDKLTVYDTSLFFRVLSIREDTSGNLREALRAAEEAWRRIQGLPEYPLLAPSVLSQLAVLYARIGRSQRALWFLERGISATKGLERLKTRLRRASVLVALGRLQEARLELESQ